MKKIIAFDLDGTLTQHKTIINEENLNSLEKLTKLYKVIIVGAGTCDRISRQLYDIKLEIIGQYGLEHASLDRDNNLMFIRKTKINIDQQYYEVKIKKLRKQFLFESFLGQGVEFHDSGVVTFPILGTDASLKDKLSFDPDRIKRRRIHHTVVDAFPDNNVFIGGTSSFDLSPKEFNKYTALKNYVDNGGYDITDVIYFGDDYGLGGNDESVYNSGFDFVKVDSYIDIPDLIYKNIYCCEKFG